MKTIKVKNRTVEDRAGKRYGKLTVIKYTGKSADKERGLIWELVCDCGNIIEANSFALTIGHKKSCGCLIKDIGVSSRKLKGEVGLRRVYNGIKGRAKNKSLDFDISLDKFKQLTSANCYYCNSEPSSISKYGDSTPIYAEAIENGKYIYNGLDRINNDLGYTLDNVLTCCASCNMLRGDNMTVQETVEVIKLLKYLRNTDNLWKDYRNNKRKLGKPRKNKT